MSMILWAVVHTYTHLRDKVMAQEKFDFARLLGSGGVSEQHRNEMPKIYKSIVF